MITEKLTSAVTLATLILLSPCVISHAEGTLLPAKPPQATPANPVVANYHVNENEDIIEAVRGLATISSVPINIEIIKKYDQPARLILPSFSIKPGNYRVGEILHRLEAASSQIHHIRSTGCINVQISLSKDIDNPFDHRISSNLDSRMSANDLISHLNQADASYGFWYEPVAVDTQAGAQSGLLEAQSTLLNLHQGQTIRTAFNAIGLNLHAHWFALVNDKDPLSIPETKDRKPEIKNGKMALLYANLKQLTGRTWICYFGISP